MPIGSTIALIASLATIAGTGTTVGLELANQPGSPKPPSTVPAVQTPADQSAIQQQQKALISQQSPNVISQTSGLTNPDYVAQISKLLSGTAGESGSSGAAQQAVAQAFGLPPSLFSGGGGGGAGTPKGFTPAGSGSSGSGSNASTQPVSLSEFVNQYI